MEIARIIISLALVLYYYCYSFTQEDGQLAEKIDPILLKIIETYDLPGLTIGIVKNSKIIYTKAFGYKNIESKESLTVDSVFHQASNSKPFTATAIMKMIEQKKFKFH